MKTAVIFGAGEQNIAQLTLPENCLVWAADGGLAYCEKLNITPDFVIGDFDSLGFVPEKAEVLPVQKDITDMAAAVEKAEEQGCDTFYIYGGTGKRLDHTLANISLLIGLSHKGKKAYLCDRDYTVTAVTNGDICFGEHEKGVISVFAADEKVHGVCEEGLLYSLDNATLENKTALGVSNEFTGRKSRIAVKEGTLVIVKNHVSS
ncbi:MAG: thiamine diphosphokinase [Clostridia bacterium]|nr:thiamine diphosphokinase [Clostridia bacterium]